MLGLKCHITKHENNYTVSPFVDHIKKLGKYRLSRQYCEKVPIGQIIDIRKIILNNCINSVSYIYLQPMNNFSYINLTNMSGRTSLYEYNRIKEKHSKKKRINYKCNYSCVNPIQMSVINDKSVIFLGQIRLTNMRNIAFEVTSCCNNYISAKGYGFISINFTCINNYNNFNSGVLYFSKKKLPEYLFPHSFQTSPSIQPSAPLIIEDLPIAEVELI